MKYKVILAAAMLLAIGALSATAQNREMSPYSMYGYGMLTDNASSTQRAMGGVGYAMSNGRQINVMNPASYAMCDSLTFLWDIGLGFTNLWSKEGTTNSKAFGGGLDYITMQFPISKTVGGSFGLVPYSSVGYAFGNSLDTGSELRQGEGGINQLYAGVAYRPFDFVSVGANFSYVFGTTTNDAYAYTTDGSTTLFERVIDVRDWGVQLGVQFSKVFAKKHRATLGVSYTPGKSLHGNVLALKYDATSDTKTDTISYSGMGGNFSTPHSIGVGLNYTYDDRLTTEVDFTYQNWKSAKFKDEANFGSNLFKNRTKIAAGLQYIPKLRGNYLQRINYRIGGHYTNDYITVRGNDVSEYGVSLGFGLPSNFSKTMVNLSFEYKRRKSSPINYIQEDYFNITIGVNFNEMWFWKNKIR